MAKDIISRIRKSGLSIYDSLDDFPELFIGHKVLERILESTLIGLDLDYPLRTRSKVVKSAICAALGYPVPPRFKRTAPRFPAQNFDTYVQKSNNLQIWNEDVSASRRYVIIRIDEDSIVTRVRVVSGDVIAALDTTGTLTHKYQAKAKTPVAGIKLVTRTDTTNVIQKLIKANRVGRSNFLPIAKVFERLSGLVGKSVPDRGQDQERHRGGALHNAVCKQLGMSEWNDNGQFPDVPEQLLEIKLQTAPTIDLGLVCPNQTEHLADSLEFRHCDVRYAVFYGTRASGKVRLNHFVLTTGEAFFTFFNQFGGKITNSKRQIPLPGDFFDQAK